MNVKTRDDQGVVDTGEVGTKPKLPDARVQDISLAAGVLIARNKRAMFGEGDYRAPVQIGDAVAAVVARLKRE